LAGFGQLAPATGISNAPGTRTISIWLGAAPAAERASEGRAQQAVGDEVIETADDNAKTSDPLQLKRSA